VKVDQDLVGYTQHVLVEYYMIPFRDKTHKMTVLKFHKYDQKKNLFGNSFYCTQAIFGKQSVMGETNNFLCLKNETETETLILGLVRSRPRPRL